MVGGGSAVDAAPCFPLRRQSGGRLHGPLAARSSRTDLPAGPREGVVLPGPTCTLLASRRPADNPRVQEGGALASLSTEGQRLPYGQYEHPVWGAPVNVAGRVLCTPKPSHEGRAGLGRQEVVARQPHGSPAAQCCRREASPPPCHRAATTWASGRGGAACWASCELRVFIPGWGGPSPSMCPGPFPGAPQSQPGGPSERPLQALADAEPLSLEGRPSAPPAGWTTVPLHCEGSQEALRGAGRAPAAREDRCIRGMPEAPLSLLPGLVPLPLLESPPPGSRGGEQMRCRLLRQAPLASERVGPTPPLRPLQSASPESAPLIHQPFICFLAGGPAHSRCSVNSSSRRGGRWCWLLPGPRPSVDLRREAPWRVCWLQGPEGLVAVSSSASVPVQTLGEQRFPEIEGKIA